jgi:8-oxo-dGTP pyrophosphatase MutT (NUDIX family)
VITFKKEMAMVLSAGIVVVRKQEEGWKYLFLRAYKNWDFPKGEVKPGEDPFETAQREVREETGITDLRFPWTREYKETLPYRGGKKIARYYIAETFEEKITLPVSSELGRPEHNEYRWLSYDEVKKRAPDRLFGIVNWAHELITRK